MGRLIDADALSEELKKHYIGVWRLDTLAKQYIDAQPTAYDVEKVVAALEKHTRIMMPVIPAKEAIDIVRKGGVE